jgi:hypothetical protein
VYEVIVAELKQLTPHRYVREVSPLRETESGVTNSLSETEINELLRFGEIRMSTSVNRVLRIF